MASSSSTTQCEHTTALHHTATAAGKEAAEWQEASRQDWKTHRVPATAAVSPAQASRRVRPSSLKQPWPAGEKQRARGTARATEETPDRHMFSTPKSLTWERTNISYAFFKGHQTWVLPSRQWGQNCSHTDGASGKAGTTASCIHTWSWTTHKHWVARKVYHALQGTWKSAFFPFGKNLCQLPHQWQLTAHHWTEPDGRQGRVQGPGEDGDTPIV